MASANQLSLGLAPPSTSLGSLDNITTIQSLLSCDEIGNINGFLGQTTQQGIQTMLNPQAAYRKNYITLDTRHRHSSSGNTSNNQGITQFQWTFLQGSAINSEGIVNSLG